MASSKLFVCSLFIIVASLFSSGCVNVKNKQKPDSCFRNVDAMEEKKQINEILKNATVMLNAGISDEMNGDYDHAIAHFKSGLNVIGNLYYVRGMIDDSGMKLTVADIQIRDGNLKNASSVFRKTLESRLRLYKDKCLEENAQHEE
jgi:hypothetical protein